MKYTLALIFLLITSLSYGQTLDSRLVGLDEEIEEWIKTYNAVGLSISIVENNQVIYSKGYGYRDLEKRESVNEHTVFHIASCSKAFTASLLGILESENKISFQEKPSIYIPDLKFYNDKMDNMISIEDLLTHKSGLGELNATLVLFPENNRMKVMSKLKYIEPLGEVKNSSNYSNMGFTVAGTVVEQVTGDSWENNVQKRIFDPLEMSNSYTELDKMEKSDNYSLGYGLSKNQSIKVPFENYYDYNPAGGIKSTANDMAKWMLTWLNEGIYNGKQILPSHYIKYAQKFHNSRQGDYEESVFLQGYGLGWRVESNGGEFKLYHGGNTSGFSSVVNIFPFKKLGVTVLSNQENSLLPYVIADIIKNRMLGLPALTKEEYPINVSDIYTPRQPKIVLNEEQKPTHELEAFTGLYHNKGYGDVEIKLEEGKLYAMYPKHTFLLEHQYYNIFLMNRTEELLTFIPEFYPLNFGTDNDGKISSFSVLFTNEPTLFIKQ